MSGDDVFYETYLAPLETRMLRTAWRITRDPDRARDALQDAMARAWAHRDRVRVHPNPGALVLRITIHAAIDRLRRERRRLRTEESVEPPAWHVSPPVGPAAAAERREVHAMVQGAIARLRRSRPQRSPCACWRSSPTRRSPRPWAAPSPPRAFTSCGAGRSSSTCSGRSHPPPEGPGVSRDEGALPDDEVDRVLREALADDLPKELEEDLRREMRRAWRGPPPGLGAPVGATGSGGRPRARPPSRSPRSWPRRSRCSPRAP